MSISRTVSIMADASSGDHGGVARADEVVEVLVKDPASQGASFVIPVDAEETRSDGLPSASTLADLGHDSKESAS